MMNVTEPRRTERRFRLNGFDRMLFTAYTKCALMYFSLPQRISSRQYFTYLPLPGNQFTRVLKIQDRLYVSHKMGKRITSNNVSTD